MYDHAKRDALLDGEKEILWSSVHVDFLSPRDVEITTKIGLPSSVAPFIELTDEASYGGYSLYDRVNIFEKYPLDNDGFKDLCLLGKTAEGYIVITPEGEICLVDVESEAILYMNKSLEAFLETTYEYMKFIETVNEKYDSPDAFFDGQYNDEDIEQLRKNIDKIDDVAADDGFWAEQLDMLFDDMQ